MTEGGRGGGGREFGWLYASISTMKNNMFLPMVISWETLNYIMFPTTGNLHVSSTWET